MSVFYEILVPGNPAALEGGFLGLSSIVLVRTPGGPMLFDTGHHATKAMLLQALEARGLRPADIGTVVLSHLHFDHANNLELFPQAQVYVSARERAYAGHPHPDDLYVPGHVLWQLERMTTHSLSDEGELAPGVRWIATPGHTPGSIALVLEQTPYGRVVLAGDAVKTAREALEARCDLAFDTVQAGSDSIRRILELADRIVPGHFPELVRAPSGSWTWTPARLPLLLR
jgi:glyoxylase-like metal-dependent hydrolase (beta-lactamase superfamily II)